MSSETERIHDEAAAWHVASFGPDMDWDAFTLWLEADPAHARSYDEVALADDLARQARPGVGEPVNDNPVALPESSRARWPMWAGGAIAASLALVLAVTQFSAPASETFASGPGSREVALADGSLVLLAPDSRLTVNGNRLALEGGGYFTILHDPARRMSVTAGGLEVADIGTVFDIQTDPASTRIAIADGRVTVRGEILDAPVDLTAGKRIVLEPAKRRATVSAISIANVGDWRKGRLTFTDAPLSLVAADLARYARTHVILAPEIGDRRFSGTLSIGDGKTAVRDLAQLMDVAVVRVGDAYRLVPAGRGS